MSESIFDVASCDGIEVPPAWIYIESDAQIDLTDSQGNVCAFEGSDACLYKLAAKVLSKNADTPTRFLVDARHPGSA